MKVFEHENYKQFVNEWVSTQPKNGYGQFKKIADFVGINSVVISQIFKGDRDLSLEQACDVAKYIGLDDLEKDFFLLLVQKGRAGSHDLTQVLNRQVKELRKKATSLKSRIKHKKFAEEDKAIFYSQWYYSASRIASDISSINSTEDISEILSLDRQTVANVLSFLLKTGLVVEKGGKLAIGPQVTHVGHDSPFVYRHHSNWRLKGMQAMDNIFPEEDLFYTGPMALSVKAAERIRNLAIELIENATKTASASESETLACLNIDWFRITNRKSLS